MKQWMKFPLEVEPIIDNCLSAFVTRGVFWTNKVHFMALLSTQLGLMLSLLLVTHIHCHVNLSRPCRTGKTLLLWERKLIYLSYWFLYPMHHWHLDEKGANHKVYSSVKLRPNPGDLYSTLHIFHAVMDRDTPTPSRTGAFTKFCERMHSDKKSKCLKKQMLYIKKS